MKASQAIEGYLHQFQAGLHLDPRTEGRVIGELASYFEEKTAELESEDGLQPAEAAQAAIRCLGPAPELARMMYAAHSRASWLEVLLACQPHLLCAALCATHLWNRPVVTLGAYLLTLAVSLLGWLRGRPAWVFAWIGYAFAPLLAGALVFRGAAVAELMPVLLLLVLLCAAGLGLLLAAAIAAARRDWLLLSFSTLPWPVLVFWLLRLRPTGLLAAAQGPAEAAAVPPLLLLAAASGLFMRLRQRSHKVGVLAAGAVAASAAATLGMDGQSALGLLLGRSAAVLLLLLLPALAKGARRPADYP